MLHEIPHTLDVRCDAFDAASTEHLACPREDNHPSEQAIGDDRLKNIQLKLPAFGRESDRHITAYDVEADLVDDLGNHRVHLAWHYRRPGLHRWQIDLAEA